MPISTNYGSTGRPPGEYHLRHSSKKLTNNLEFLQPPFDIYFIEITNDNNNNKNCIICYDNNGGIICNEGILVDSEAGAADDADDDNDDDDDDVDVDVDADVLMNQNESN
jgi:hypothetical protein